MRLLPIACLAALVVACAGPTAPEGTVNVTAQPAEVSPGGEVTITVENRTSSPVVPNWCGPVPLQRANGEGWSAFRWHAGPEQGLVCLGIGLSIPPGESYAMPVRLADDIPEGQYRVLLRMSIGGRGGLKTLPSSGFTVRP